jgi:membrane-bound lytic murein transglycosylase B
MNKAKHFGAKAAPFVLAATVATMSFLYTSRIIENRELAKPKPVASAVAQKDTLKPPAPVHVKIPFRKSTLESARKYLLSRGFEKGKIDSLLSDTRIEKLAIFPKRNEGEPKKQLTYKEYKKIFGVEQLAKKAAEFYKENRELVGFLSAFTPAPPELALSILGIESKFGANTGRHTVLNVYLTYLEDRPKRTDFALDEIEALMRICGKYGKDPLEVKGSHGGAIGPMQFIPSSLVKFDTSGTHKSFEDLVSVKSALVLVFTYLSHSGADSYSGFSIGGVNYNAAFAYNPRIIMRGLRWSLQG